MRNFPGTDVNIVGKDMPIVRISPSIVPLMPAANDELFVESLIIRENQCTLFTCITLFEHV